LNNVNYYFADHLGTARVVTNSSGTILDDSDFYPFGGERMGGTCVVREESGKQKPRSCRAQELARSSAQ